MQFSSESLPGILLIIAAALMVCWFGWTVLRKSEDPGKVMFKFVLTVVLLSFLAMNTLQLGALAPGLAAALGVILGILWAPNLGAMLAKPFTNLFDGGDVQVELRPFYSIAIGKRKMGKYDEAIAEIQKQLDRFPNDFEGWLMLAEIYADNLHDLEAAQNCLQEILSQPAHTPRNIAYALTRMADWHMSMKQDRSSACALFEQIIRRFPDTEESHHAQQRLAHLTTEEMLDSARARPAIFMPHYEARLGLEGKVADPRKPDETPAEAAGRLVRHLDEHPQDWAAREELARIYAHHYQRMDLASDQLEQMIQSPNPSQKNVAHWLNMLADLHIATNGDTAQSSAALQRIIERYPKTAVAASAEKRIAYVSLEMKKKEKSHVLQLGSAEHNIGLKGQVPQKR